METLQVKSVRWKTFLLLLACLGFIAIGVWMLFMALAEWPKEIFGLIIGLMSVLFFGAAFPLGVKRLF